jgi:hypothetical protein
MTGKCNASIEAIVMFILCPRFARFRDNRKRAREATNFPDDRDQVNPSKRARFDEMVSFDNFEHTLESTLHEFKGRDRYWPYLKRHLKVGLRESFEFLNYYARIG